MNVHSNTPSYEVLEHLRELAIRNGSRPAMIDAIDNLRTVEDLDERLDKADEALTDVEKDRDDLVEAIQDLLKALDESPSCEWEKKSPLWHAIGAAEAAVTRAEQYQSKA